MGAVIDLLLSGPGLVIVLAAGAIWLGLRPQSRNARRFLQITAAAYILASAYIVPFGVASALLTRHLHPFTSSDVERGRTAIVILGGGGGTARLESRQVGIMNYETAARMLAGLRAYELSGAEWIVSSGGLVTQERPNETSAEMMRDGLVALGVPAARIVLEPDARDTHEEAVAIASLLRRLGAEHVILVTSDVHMPRALGAFHAEGLNPVPAIAPDARRPVTVRDWLAPTSHGLEYTDRVLHELIGNVYYLARGWSTSDASTRDAK
jgi:uncharacterized SAM-binding protein YcdF (DUF218 family)